MLVPEVRLMELTKRLERLKLAVSEVQPTGGRDKFSKDIQNEAVALSEKLSVRQISSAIGVSHNKIYTWIYRTRGKILPRKNASKTSSRKQPIAVVPRENKRARALSVTRVSLNTLPELKTENRCLAKITLRESHSIEIFDCEVAVRILAALRE
jgi:transposase-like protein